jgi:hypothetical protein
VRNIQSVPIFPPTSPRNTVRAAVAATGSPSKPRSSC